MRGVRTWIVSIVLCCCGCHSVERLFPQLAADRRKPMTPAASSDLAALPGETVPADDAVASAAKANDPAKKDRAWPPGAGTSRPPIDPHILKRKGIESGSREASRLAQQSQYLDSPDRLRVERETHGIAAEHAGTREYSFQYQKKLE